MNLLLKHQLKKHFGKEFDTKLMDENLQCFIDDISSSYDDLKKDKMLVERVLEVNSQELNKTNKDLKDLNNSLEEQVSIEIEKNTKKEKLLQDQSRLAQMGEMISMIAHQWRQPLSAINTTAIGIETKLMLNKFDLSCENDRAKFTKFLLTKINDINSFVQGLSSTIDDFRNFFKPDKDKELVNLTEPIKRALKIVEISLSSKSISLVTEFNCDEELLIYQNEIMQVILNILKNSEDNFSDKNIQNKKVIITTFKREDNYIITIKDNGGGISVDILPNIFNPYFSTKSEKNGTGLGLYMSKIIIEEHNCGELNAKNINDGICFEIILKDNNV